MFLYPMKLGILVLRHETLEGVVTTTSTSFHEAGNHPLGKTRADTIPVRQSAPYFDLLLSDHCSQK